MMKFFIKFADTLSTSMGKAFSWCIVILMGGTVYEVVMAYVFNAPTLWNFDFSMQMYGAILMMSGAYCLATESHVRGDVIYRLFSQRTQAWIDLVLYFLFFFPGVVALAFYGYEYAALAWKIKETSWSSPAQIQIYMVKSMIPAAGVLLIIQGISEVFRSIICIQTGQWPARLVVAEETEQVLMRAYLRGGGNNYGLDKMTEAVNDSLKRLQTDYIDLYQLHWPERNTNMFGRLGYEHKENGGWNKFEDVLGNLKRFVDAGKIREIGLSNETPWGVSKYLELSKEKNLPRMMSIQNPYSLLNRTYEVGLAEISIRDEIGLLAYSPLASGYLSGKYRNNQLPKNSRIERDPNFWTRYAKPNTEKAVDAYYEIANKHGLDLAQMSLKFLEIQPFVTSVIIGATTMEQLKTNIESVNINLSDDVIKEINNVQTIYPNPCP